MRMPVAAVPALVCALLVLRPAGALGQSSPSYADYEAVTFSNPVDGMPLVARLALPAGEAPFPGMVLLSLAGVEEMIGRLTRLGWAVLLPERRGIATIEHLLRASFEDMANDVRAALRYLRSRPEIDAMTVGLVAQGGETMAGMLAAIEPPTPAFVALLSTTGLPGDEAFRIEQRRIAEARSYDADALAALDDYVLRLSEIMMSEPSPGLRAFRTRALMAEADVVLPINAAFPPNPEDQVRFFASTWWRDFFLFTPTNALARMRSPVIVILGMDDPLLPYEAHLPAVERGLAEASTADVTVCVLPGRVQHTLSPMTSAVVEGWLTERATPAGFRARPGNRPAACTNLPEG